MKKFIGNVKKDINTIKKSLPAEDILVFEFQTNSGRLCALIYADGMVNKQLLGELVTRPLYSANLPFEPQKQGSMVELNENSEPKKGSNQQGEDSDFDGIFSHQQDVLTAIKEILQFPELKDAENVLEAEKEVLDGNTLLLIDGLTTGIIIGAKYLPVRAIMEPPTDIAVKGPREGFIEDVKTNMALTRKRIKSSALRFEMHKIGKQSATNVVVCYLEGITPQNTVDEVTDVLGQIDVDYIPDSSYISNFLSPQKHSIFARIGTTEKPDVFAAKIAEGRVGVLVDGSPIALTLPFLLTENFQTGEDYFTSPFTATVFRLIRLVSLLIAIFLPAFYVSVQLYKMQLVPLRLMMTIASATQNIPLSPAMEMFVVLLVLEVLKESSIRMPKYVGMSLSVVGALVLGETAVKAGFFSTPSIIIGAFSGICLYTVPDFVETGSLLRWLFLLVAGNFGPFGIVLLSAFIFVYLVSADAFGAPLIAPFSPLLTKDLRDSVIKYSMENLSTRPAFLNSPNKTRLKLDKKSKEGGQG